MTSKLTIAQVSAYHRDAKTIDLKAGLLVAQAAAQVLREAVDALLVPELEKFGFVRDDNGAPITREEKLYLSEQDELMLRWYARRDEIIRGAGWAIPEDSAGEGWCPALVAEHEAIKAESKLLDHACAWFGLPEIYNLELRKQALVIFAANAA